MEQILQDFPIKASAGRVFQAVSAPACLDCWWTKRSAGQPVLGAQYQLWFGPDFDWRALVTKCVANQEFELQLQVADEDWMGTRLGFELEARRETTWVKFHHTGWPSANEHYRASSHCWALYLRLLRRYLENGETIEYELRLDA